MRSLVLLALISTTSCYAEMTGGYYRAKGGLDDDAYQIGIAFGTYLEYSKFVRAGVGGEGGMILGAANPDGRVRPRTVSTTIRGDVSLVTGAFKRIRATGGVTFGTFGDAQIKDEAGMKTTGSSEAGGWFAGLSAEQTDLKSMVTRQLTVAAHQIKTESDIYDDATLTGAQVRLTFTFWPVFEPVGCGFLGCLFNMMANNSVAGETEYAEQDTSQHCAPVKSCSMAFNGEVCNYYSSTC